LFGAILKTSNDQTHLVNDKTTPNDEPALAPDHWNEQTRRRKQLEILNHFGTIDFDPDYDPIKLRQLERDRMKRL
jgi:hypothetical protein